MPGKANAGMWGGGAGTGTGKGVCEHVGVSTRACWQVSAHIHAQVRVRVGTRCNVSNEHITLSHGERADTTLRRM